MKKQIIIVLFFSIQTSAQNATFPKLKISVPCTQEFLDNYRGRWLIPLVDFSNSRDQIFSQEAKKRAQEAHKLSLEIYPQPMGCDAIWSAGYSKNYFADKVKYVTEDNTVRKDYITMNPVSGWTYGVVLCQWLCDKTANQIWNGYPEIAAGGLTIKANNISEYADMPVAEDNIMTIDGLQIKYKSYVSGTWKGYDVLTSAGGIYAEASSDRTVIITRKGMSPWIPVTRKQYLEKAVVYVTKFYDEMNVYADKEPDKQEAEQHKKKNNELKMEALKKYEEALDQTTENGLLSAPAIVLNGPLNEPYGPIFSTEANGARMIVTDNPNYFRKDLPKYIPQVFVLNWSWSDGKLKCSKDFRTAIEENFPIEKLQAMIDK
jgi:hypothetical protein